MTMPSTFITKLRSTLSPAKKKKPPPAPNSFTLSPAKKKKPPPAPNSFTLSPAKKKKPPPAPNSFHCVFRYFDENGDGKISPDELRACMRAAGEELSLEQAEAAVRSADSDGDGMLGLEEFVELVEAKEEGEEEGRSLKEAFEVYEMEGEGCITARSLRRALRRLLGESRSVEECRAMIRRFDENGDGVISFDEFKRMMVMM